MAVALILASAPAASFAAKMAGTTPTLVLPVPAIFQAAAVSPVPASGVQAALLRLEKLIMAAPKDAKSDSSPEQAAEQAAQQFDNAGAGSSGGEGDPPDGGGVPGGGGGSAIGGSVVSAPKEIILRTREDFMSYAQRAGGSDNVAAYLTRQVVDVLVSQGSDEQEVVRFAREAILSLGTPRYQSQRPLQFEFNVARIERVGDKEEWKRALGRLGDTIKDRAYYFLLLHRVTENTGEQPNFFREAALEWLRRRNYSLANIEGSDPSEVQAKAEEYARLWTKIEDLSKPMPLGQKFLYHETTPSDDYWRFREIESAQIIIRLLEKSDLEELHEMVGRRAVVHFYLMREQMIQEFSGSKSPRLTGPLISAWMNDNKEYIVPHGPSLPQVRKLLEYDLEHPMLSKLWRRLGTWTRTDDRVFIRERVWRGSSSH